MKIQSIWLVATCLALPVAAREGAPQPKPFIEYSTSYILRPALGESARAEVGESLYSEGASTITKKLTGTVMEAVSVQMENYRLDVAAGSVRPVSIRAGSPRPMMCFPVSRTGFGSLFGNRGFFACLVDTKGVKTFDAATFAHQAGDFPLDKPVPYVVEVSETLAIEQDKFQIEVLYQGMSKGEVKISYREFMNGTARPAFTQDVSYELDADGTAVIGFKGMRLKVLKATGHSIEYVLEKPIPSFTKTRATIQEEINQKGTKPWYQ